MLCHLAVWISSPHPAIAAATVMLISEQRAGSVAGLKWRVVEATNPLLINIKCLAGHALHPDLLQVRPVLSLCDVRMGGL